MNAIARRTVCGVVIRQNVLNCYAVTLQTSHCLSGGVGYGNALPVARAGGVCVEKSKGYNQARVANAMPGQNHATIPARLPTIESLADFGATKPTIAIAILFPISHHFKYV